LRQGKLSFAKLAQVYTAGETVSVQLEESLIERPSQNL
jgi:hypothetical protein